MAAYDLRPLGGRALFDRDDPVEADVPVRDGRAAGIAAPRASGPAADLLDLRGCTRTAPNCVLSGAGQSICKGWAFKGRILHIRLRERSVLRDGELDPAAPGHGEFVRRRLNQG